jgi:hypothetical protein
LRRTRLRDHTTIARFRQRHEAALAGLFGDVLALCAEAGLVQVGTIAVDGTKVQANASQHATRDFEQIAREILEQADAVDAAENKQFGDARGDELPPELCTAQGRRGWLREAKRRLDERRAAEARPIPRSRPERLEEAKRRLEEEHQVERRAKCRLRGLPRVSELLCVRPWRLVRRPVPPPRTLSGQIQMAAAGGDAQPAQASPARLATA